MSNWFLQLVPLGIQSLIIGSIFLVAYRLKKYFGNAVLFIILGLFRYLHIIISNSYHVEIKTGLGYSPASAIIYTGLLFMVLLIYVIEDALEARKLIYAMIFANFVILIIHFSISHWYHFAGLITVQNLPVNYFNLNVGLYSFGTVLLFIESFLVILLFEFLTKFTTNIFLRITTTMFILIAIHSVLFASLGYIVNHQFSSFLVGGFISKIIVSFYYSLLFSIFLLLPSTFKLNITNDSSFKDVFNVLTFRQKYEQAVISKKIIEKELHKTTFEFEKVFNEAPLGMAIYNYNSKKIEKSNIQYQQILGKSFEDLLHTDWEKNTHPDDLNTELKYVKLLEEGKIETYSLNKRIKRKGKFIWVNLKILPFTDEINDEKKHLVILENIATQKKAEDVLIKNKEKLKLLVEKRTKDLNESQIALLNVVEDLNSESAKLITANNKLEEINEELKAFTYSVSHDLKAPLRAISQLSYWLSQDYADKIDEEGQNHLKLLIGRAQRLNELIEGLLQYSRAGRSREKEINLNLDKLIKERIGFLDITDNISITFNQKLPNFKGDPVRIGQLFQNLIENAIKYSDKPKIIINIGFTLKNDFFEFYIKDNGPGIEEKYFDRIFQIFQRLESRDTKEGTGIGLSLVKRIVQLYGGKIWLTSKIGEGTTFYFTLPVSN